MVICTHQIIYEQINKRAYAKHMTEHYNGCKYLFSAILCVVLDVDGAAAGRSDN